MPNAALSFGRYRRVYEILVDDPALKQKLSTQMMAFCLPDQRSVDMPVEVAYVTEEIHRRGADAITLTKAEIVRFACGLLILQDLDEQLFTDTNMSTKTTEQLLVDRVASLKNTVAEQQKALDASLRELKASELALSAVQTATAAAAATPALTTRLPATLNPPTLPPTLKLGQQTFATVVTDFMVSRRSAALDEICKLFPQLSRSACYHRVRDFARKNGTMTFANARLVKQ